MRKSTIVGAIIPALVLALAQPAQGQQNLAGVKGGFVSADVSTDVAGQDVETDSRSGIGGGAFLQVRVGESFSIQPEALYVPKGFGTFLEGVDATIKTNYVQIPILVQVHVPTDGTVSPRLFVGPSLAFQSGCDVEGMVEGETVEMSCEEADVVVNKSTDFGAVLGAGVDIAAGSVIVTLDGRYDFGLSNLLEEGDGEVNTRTLEVFAGVGVPIGP